MKTPIVFDIEVLKNVFLCCCYNTKTKQIVRFEISERHNDLQDLVLFFSNKEYVFIGYNNLHYDGPIIYHLISKFSSLTNKSYVEITNQCYTISNSIITSERFPFWKLKNQNHFSQIDLMPMMASKALRVGLKSLQVTMCYKNVKEMGLDWKNDLDSDRIDDLIFYCDNDIMSTHSLLCLLKNDLKLRMAIQDEFKIACLSKDGVGIGVDIFTKYVCEAMEIEEQQLINYRDNYSEIKVKDFIVPIVKFKTKPLQDVLEWYNNLVLDEKGFLNGKPPTGEVHINKLTHSYGIGGLHSVNKPKVYIATDKVLIRDKDVKRCSVLTL